MNPSGDALPRELADAIARAGDRLSRLASHVVFLAITGSTNDGIVLPNSNAFVNVTESIISGNGGSAVNVAAAASTANIDRTTMANNAAALNASASGATIRAIGNNVFNNTTAVSIAAGGIVATDGQNRSGGNTSTQAPNVSVTLF